MSGRRAFGSITRERSGRWRVRYRAEGRMVSAGTFDRRVDADAYLAEIHTRRRHGEWVDPRLGDRAFGEFAAAWDRDLDRRGLSAKTRATYRSTAARHVLGPLGSIPVAQVNTGPFLKAFVRDHLDDHGPGEVHKTKQVIASIIDLALDDGAVVANHAKGLKLPNVARREPQILTPGQVERLAGEVREPSDRSAGHDGLALLVESAPYLGLRAGEFAGLRARRVDLDRRVIVVAETLYDVDGALVWGPTKNGRHRHVDIPKSIADDLARHLAAAGATGDATVFASPRGGLLRWQNFYRRVFKPAVRRAGLPDGTCFHSLRHTYASWLIANGEQPKVISELMGHSSIDVTMDVYGHLMPGTRARAVAGLDQIRPGRRPPP